MFNGRSKILFVASLVTTFYVIYLIYYFIGTTTTATDSAEELGGVLATALVMPHMFFMGLGALFSWLGFFMKKSWAALVAAILYCVGAFMFIVYAMFTIPSIILGFIGYSKQKKLNSNSNVA